MKLIELFIISNDHGGHLFVKKINGETCNSLSGHEGSLQLENCTYTCEMPENFEAFQSNKTDSTFQRYQEASTEKPSEEDDYDENKVYLDESLAQPEALTQGKFSKTF